jgi:hypothetical protein
MGTQIRPCYWQISNNTYGRLSTRIIHNENSPVWFLFQLFSDKPRRIGPKAISCEIACRVWIGHRRSMVSNLEIADLFKALMDSAGSKQATVIL